MPGPRSNSARLSCYFAAAFIVTSPAGVASAQTADTILFNGKILTVDKDFSTQQAVAIGDGRILATGASAAMKKLAGRGAKLIDLGGRTVIPGLTDGHIHGIRAALTFGTEVNWIGVPTLKDALEKIGQAAKAQKPGSWIVVAGGWTEEQFAEKRRPTPAEVAAVAPDNPVYIQHLYDWLLLSPKAMEALNVRDDNDVAPGGKLARDSDNKPTGIIDAGGAALGKIFDRLPKPTMEQQIDGSKKFFREMNSLGITGIVDGRRQHVSRELPGRVPAVAGQAADRACRLSPLRAKARQRARRPAKPDATLAAGIRRRDAALQRPRRNPDLGRLDRRRHHARRQGEACRTAALGGVKALHHPAALAPGPHRPRPARRGRGHQPGFSGARPALGCAASLHG